MCTTFLHHALCGWRWLDDITPFARHSLECLSVSRTYRGIVLSDAAASFSSSSLSVIWPFGTDTIPFGDCQRSLQTNLYSTVNYCYNSNDSSDRQHRSNSCLPYICPYLASYSILKSCLPLKMSAKQKIFVWLRSSGPLCFNMAIRHLHTAKDRNLSVYQML